MTLKEIRDGFIIKQGLTCAICKRMFDELLKPQLDHCHKSDRCRGALCGACNAGLGMFNDDLKVLLAAMVYLSKDHSANPFYPGSEEDRAQKLLADLKADPSFDYGHNSVAHALHIDGE